MEYTVELTLRTARPVTERVLECVAEIGGVAVGNIGGRRIETTLTVSASGIHEAIERGMTQIGERVRGTVIAAEALTTEEFDRREAERPQLVGVTEIAGMLGVSRQRVSTLSKRNDFPRPLESLASGPVWRRGDLSTFADGWRRKPGRPRRATAS